MNYRLLTILLGAFTWPTASVAASSDVQFDGTVTHSCAIVVDANGTLGVRPDFRVLNSAFADGAPGRATVTSTGNTFTISVDNPSAFDAQPPEDTQPNTFFATYRVTGATNIARTDTPQTLNHGTNTVRVHLRVRKPVGEVFEAGDYSATVVLRCE